MSAFGCQRMNGTFETVKYMRFTSHAHFKTLIVFVSADLAFVDVAIASK
jgi:hypothetical protein